MQHASSHNQVHIVQYLLSTGRVNPLAADQAWPHCNASSYAGDNYDIIKLFQETQLANTSS